MRETMLILHFIGLAMGLGVSFAYMFLGIASSKMETAEGQKFMLNAFAISTMGHIGLGLLVISGLYLITPYWSVLPEMPLLIVKLVLVLVLGALIGMISAAARKAKQGDPEVHMKRTEFLGKFTLPITLIIVILAVLVFH